MPHTYTNTFTEALARQAAVALNKQLIRVIRRLQAVERRNQSGIGSGVELDNLRALEEGDRFSEASQALVHGEALGEKLKRVISLDSISQMSIATVVVARLFRAFFLFFNDIYNLHPAKDDDAVYRPTYWTLFAIANVEMLSAIIYIGLEKWRGNKIDVQNGSVLLEFLETSVAITRTAYYIRDALAQSETLMFDAGLLAAGVVVGGMGVLSDLKDQQLSLYAKNHGHRNQGTVPIVDAKGKFVPPSAPVYNFSLRSSHLLAIAVVLFFSFMDTIEVAPIPSSWQENPNNAAKIAIGFALAYTLTSILSSMSSSKSVVLSDSALQALTVGCLSFIASFLYSIDAQLWVNNQYDSSYILQDQIRFWSTAMLPALMLTGFAVYKSIKEHQRNAETKEAVLRGTDAMQASQEARYNERLDLTSSPPSVTMNFAATLLQQFTGDRELLPNLDEVAQFQKKQHLAKKYS